MNVDRKARVTVEDLLRLKRLEKPPEQFWTDFDSELRAKQLAAIVEKRPWWAVSSRFSGVFSRYSLPLGAAAALALAVGGLHEYQAWARASANKSEVVRLDDAQAGGNLAVAGSSVDASLAADGLLAADSTKTAADLQAAGSSLAGSEITPAAAVTEGRATPVNFAYSSQPIDAVPVRSDYSNRNWAGRMDSISGRSIALNLSSGRGIEPVVVRNLFGLAQNLDSGLVPERSPVPEPLAQMTSPAEEGRARFLAEALPVSVSVNSADAPPPSSDRLISHLRDDRMLNESISRYGVGSDRLSFKVRFSFGLVRRSLGEGRRLSFKVRF